MAEQTKENKEEPEGVNYQLPFIVEIIPGAANRGYVYPLGKGEEAYSTSIETLLKNAVTNEAPSKEHKSDQEILKSEYNSEAQITIEGKTVNKRDLLQQYVANITVKKTSTGKEYNLLKIRVTKPQEGGLEYII